MTRYVKPSSPFWISNFFFRVCRMLYGMVRDVWNTIIHGSLGFLGLSSPLAQPLVARGSPLACGPMAALHDLGLRGRGGRTDNAQLPCMIVYLLLHTNWQFDAGVSILQVINIHRDSWGMGGGYKHDLGFRRVPKPWPLLQNVLEQSQWLRQRIWNARNMFSRRKEANVVCVADCWDGGNNYRDPFDIKTAQHWSQYGALWNSTCTLNWRGNICADHYWLCTVVKVLQ